MEPFLMKGKEQSTYFSRQNHQNPILIFGDNTLHPQSKLTWLGIWLYPKFTYNTHLTTIRGKGNKQFHNYNKSTSCTPYWLKKKPKTFGSVLRAHFLHGRIVLFTVAKFNKVFKLFRFVYSPSLPNLSGNPIAT